MTINEAEVEDEGEEDNYGTSKRRSKDGTSKNEKVRKEENKDMMSGGWEVEFVKFVRCRREFSWMSKTGRLEWAETKSEWTSSSSSASVVDGMHYEMVQHDEDDPRLKVMRSDT